MLHVSFFLKISSQLKESAYLKQKHSKIQFIFHSCPPIKLVIYPPLEIFLDKAKIIFLTLNTENNGESCVVSYFEVLCVAQSHFCINKHPWNPMTFAVVLLWKQEVHFVLILPPCPPYCDCVAVATGTESTLANVLHLLYRHALSLFSSLSRQLKSS